MRRFLVGMVLLGSVTACTGDPAAAPTPVRRPVAAATTTATTPPYPTPSLPDVPLSFDFHEVGAGKGFRDTAPFAGRYLHPIKIPIPGPDAPAEGGELELPSVPETWKEQNPRAVQLVACITSRPGPRLKTCTYVSTSGPPRRWTVDMRWGEFTIDVRAARTGRRIAPTVRVRGGDTGCHEYDVRESTDDRTPLLTFLTEAQVTTTIGRWVTTPR